MLAAADLARETWGAEFKRVIRAAAALMGLYDDTAIAEEVGRGRMTVAGWWRGAKPEPNTLAELAEALGIPVDELYQWVYLDGPPPLIKPSQRERDRATREAQAWADSASPRRDDRSDPDTRRPTAPRSSGA